MNSNHLRLTGVFRSDIEPWDPREHAVSALGPLPGQVLCHQQTELDVADGGQLLFCEWLAPGRVAGGESFAFDELLWDTDIHFGGQLCARERYRLSPDDFSLTPLRTAFPHSHYLGFFAIGWPHWPAQALDEMDATDGLWCGHGPLSAGGGTVKILCADSLIARRTFHRVREIFYAALGRNVPALRRF